jgi:hypothetical protein
MYSRRGGSLVEVLTALFISGVFMGAIYFIFMINHEASQNYIVRADLSQEMNKIVDQVVSRARGARMVAAADTTDQKTATLQLPGSGMLEFQIMRNGHMIMIDAEGQEVLSERVDFERSDFIVNGKSLLVKIVLVDAVLNRQVSLASSTEIFPRNF